MAGGGEGCGELAGKEGCGEVAGEGGCTERVDKGWPAGFTSPCPESLIISPTGDKSKYTCKGYLQLRVCDHLNN